jgi:thiamine biosynthesis lipoprotein
VTAAAPRAFRAMGCASVVGGATAAEAAAVAALFAAWDARFSRFRPDSELCAVNRSRAAVVAVSAPFAAALGTALDAARSTGGLVDPTLLRALEHAGYDADFARVAPDSAVPAGRPVPGRWADVHLDGRLLVRPVGVGLDLAGVVKGMAVDAALALLGGPGHVAAGGDLATSRPLDVALPAGGRTRLLAGALATSATTTRCWRRGGAQQHHLIDPRTGRPARSRWAQATVCGATCAGADVAAKAALLLDGDGPGWLDDHELPGRLVAHDGTVVVSAAWRAQAGAREAACT